MNVELLQGTHVAVFKNELQFYFHFSAQSNFHFIQIYIKKICTFDAYKR